MFTDQVPMMGKSADKPYPRGIGQYEQRNEIAPLQPESDQGPGTEGIRVPPVDPKDIMRIIALSQSHLLRMLADKGFDFTHPVDEYGPQGTPGAIGSITLQPDYDMPERIESFIVVVPVGATSALMQLGQRSLQLYAGAALAAPLVIVAPCHGIIINSDDPRNVVFTGTITSQGYFGLTGYALTRGQFS
jgi:hypothetical protein